MFHSIYFLPDSFNAPDSKMFDPGSPIAFCSSAASIAKTSGITVMGWFNLYMSDQI
jgi:hypothetical protein